jgi:hypothetical protein
MNAFNLVSNGVIFQELHALGGKIIQLIPFVCAFYEFESPLFYSHHNRDGDVIIIPSAMGTRQRALLRGALFSLIHFRAISFTTSHFFFCLFPSIADDIHTINPLGSIISFTHEHFQIEFRVISVFIQFNFFTT